jgi:hypothetical protein
MILGGLCADAGRKLSHDSHIMTQTGGSEVGGGGTAAGCSAHAGRSRRLEL